MHKEERKCWRRSVRYECVLKFFIYYVFTILCSCFSFGKLLFKVSFPVFLLIDESKGSKNQGCREGTSSVAFEVLIINYKKNF